MRRRSGSQLSLTSIFIIVNVIVFVAFILAYSLGGILGYDPEKLLGFLALNPENVVKGYFWTLLTSMFMHGNFSHILVNMISMFFIGSFVERLIGRKRFFWFYFISGIAAGAFFAGFAYFGSLFPWGANVFGGIDSYAVGASGALFGLGGLLAVLVPNLRVLVFFIIPMRMWTAMAFLMIVLWILSALSGLPIGNTAHLGGLVTGLVYGFYLRTKYSRKIKILNRAFGA